MGMFPHRVIPDTSTLALQWLQTRVPSRPLHGDVSASSHTRHFNIGTPVATDQGSIPPSPWGCFRIESYQTLQHWHSSGYRPGFHPALSMGMFPHRVIPDTSTLALQWLQTRVPSRPLHGDVSASSHTRHFNIGTPVATDQGSIPPSPWGCFRIESYQTLQHWHSSGYRPGFHPALSMGMFPHRVIPDTSTLALQWLQTRVPSRPLHGDVSASSHTRHFNIGTPVATMPGT